MLFAYKFTASESLLRRVVALQQGTLSTTFLLFSLMAAWRGVSLAALTTTTTTTTIGEKLWWWSV
jgi:hypothetical protein